MDTSWQTRRQSTPGRIGARRGGSVTTRQVRCECGFVARGDTDEVVIQLVLEHVAADHPELAEIETADYIRGWIELLPR